MNERAVHRIGKVAFDAATPASACATVISAAKGPGTGSAIRLANAWSVVLADSDPDYADVLNAPGYTFADGKPVALLVSRAVADSAQVRGPSLFESVLDAGREQDIRHFLLGATEVTLLKLEETIASRYPGAIIAGTFAPPFGPINDQLLDEASTRISTAGAQVVWVGMGTPKQDFLARDLVAQTGAVCVGVGAAFDFVAGTVPTAPRWMQRSGLEWLFRLASEPKRLWRRYLIGNVKFLAIVMQA